MPKQDRANFLTSITRIEIHLGQARQRDRSDGVSGVMKVSIVTYTVHTVRMIRTSS